MYIPFFDLKRQYQQLKNEIDEAISDCLNQGKFIGGEIVQQFEGQLSEFTGIKNTVSCGNGTDALQLALMSLDLPKNSKIIIPSFTYIAPVEVAEFLGYEIIFADVDATTFNLTLEEIRKVYTDNVRAIIAVHLFGLPCADIEKINTFCKKKSIFLIEDNAQSLGAERNITRDSIITTSFFPTKNLGAHGDGGAVLTSDTRIAKRIKQIAQHGQAKKYEHEIIGINSRLDTLQAAVLKVKLKHFESFLQKRRTIAHFYTEALKNIPSIKIPDITAQHTFHQYTIRVEKEQRNSLKEYLSEQGIETNIYYHLPAHQQVAYQQNICLKHTETLSKTVLSLPIFPELAQEEISYITETIKNYF